MENPHAERQAVLLERIVKNAVSRLPCRSSCHLLTPTSVCMHRDDSRTQPLHRGTPRPRERSDPIRACDSYGDQEILRANASVGVAADLATKYRKNVQYNLEATKHEFKS